MDPSAHLLPPRCIFVLEANAVRCAAWTAVEKAVRYFKIGRLLFGRKLFGRSRSCNASVIPFFDKRPVTR